MSESLQPKAKRARQASTNRQTNLSGESSSALIEDQLECSICLDVFTDPVTTSCGHSFCKGCITQSWDMSQQYYCPLCKKKFPKRPEVNINIALRDVAVNFKKKNAFKQLEVLCDYCKDTKQKAVKSCLSCEVSLCVTHLNLHNKVQKCQKHKLINAMEDLEKYRCKKHEKPLELFCLNDQKCVCQFCLETDHKNHNVIPLEKESGQRKSQLGKRHIELQQMIQKRLKKIQEIIHSVELSKSTANKDKPDNDQVFTLLMSSIENSQAELKEKRQKVVEKQAEELIKELKNEISVLKRKDSELERILHTEDHIHLLELYPSLCSIPHTRNWTGAKTNPEKSMAALTFSALSQIQHNLHEKLKVAVSTELKRIQHYEVDVTLDPDTAYPTLELSADGKQVKYTNTGEYFLNDQKRFTYYPVVLGKQGFSSGRFYYEVQVGEKTRWHLGVVKESVNRNGRIETFKPLEGFWTVILRKEDDYRACDDHSISLRLREKPRKVGVFVDYEEGLVSFYNVESMSHIYSFTGQSFTETLYPYFSPSERDEGKNVAPLIISQLIKPIRNLHFIH